MVLNANLRCAEGATTLCGFVVWTIVLLASPAWGGTEECPGDCDGDGTVRVHELLRMVKAARVVCLIPEPELCPRDSCLDLDLDSDGVTSISELNHAINLIVTAVGNAMRGCGWLPDRFTGDSAHHCGNIVAPSCSPG